MAILWPNTRTLASGFGTYAFERHRRCGLRHSRDARSGTVVPPLAVDSHRGAGADEGEAFWLGGGAAIEVPHGSRPYGVSDNRHPEPRPGQAPPHSAGRWRVPAVRPPLTLSVRRSSPATIAVRHFGHAAEGGLARLPRLGGRSTQPRGAGEEVASLGLADGPAGGLAVAGARCVAVAGHRQQVGPHGHEVV